MERRTPEELERIAFKEELTLDEYDPLVEFHVQRAATEGTSRNKAPSLKQAAFFSTRAFEKGARDPERVGKYVKLLTDAQRIDPSDRFRRKLAEMKSVLAGKDSHTA